MDRAPFAHFADFADLALIRPPLPFTLTWSPVDAAEQLVSSFRAVAEMGDRVGWVHREIAFEIGPVTDVADRALLSAGQAIAASIDDDPAFYDRLAYHNRQHFCEVMLTTHFLCRLSGIPAHESRLLLLAALIHDIEHDGVPGERFSSERRSIDRAAPWLSACGVDAETIADLTALVLATEPRDGVAAAVAAHRGHVAGHDLPAVATQTIELQPLFRDARLARMAVLLCEADILPSVGLTPAYAIGLQDRLAREWQRTLGREDKLGFIDGVLQAGVVGAYFLPNVRALHEQMANAPHGREG